MTQAQIEENYNVSCDFLYYNGLRLSIPQGWLEHIFNTENIGTTTVEQIPSVKVKLGNKFVDIRKMTCSQIYWAEIKSISQDQQVTLNGNQSIFLQLLIGIK